LYPLLYQRLKAKVETGQFRESDLIRNSKRSQQYSATMFA
jgi:hypothetical protein